MWRWFSILGTISKNNNQVALTDLKKVVLVIPETTRAYRERNGGPQLHILNEYTLGCVLTDVLNLQRLGIEVEIERQMILDK